VRRSFTGRETVLLGQIHKPSRLASLLKPELLVIGFCFLLPDLMDKPLWVLGVISNGRYIGHTLLMVFLVAVGFGMAKRTYGLLAPCGSIPHLLFDTGGHSNNPWFYPFRRYDFPPNDFHRVVTLPNIMETVMEMALVFCVLLLVWAVYRGLVLLHSKRCGTASAGGKDVIGIGEVNSRDDRTSRHGTTLCWTARIGGTLLSLCAATYVLFTRAEYESAWSVIAAAVCVFALSMAPSLVAWWSHRVGGAFVLIVCIAYTELASRIVEGASFVHLVLPLSAVWAATGILHLVLSWKERPKDTPPT
jgi:hypothetical protein